MNTKRLILSIVVLFVTLFATDFLIHGVWLKGAYKETAHLWRPEAEMGKFFPFLLLGQLLATVPFVVIWFQGAPAASTLGRSCLYGLTMGVYGQAMTCILYAVQPMPANIMLSWGAAGLAQAVLLGAVLHCVGRPKPAAAV